MIEYVAGSISHKTPNSVVVETGGVGLMINISSYTYSKLDLVGDPVKLLTYLQIRDDSFQLYGFYSENERLLFTLLLNVKGIGPKLAVGILSAVNPENLLQKIRLNSISELTSISGIGQRTAERIIVELKNKIPHLDLSQQEEKGNQHHSIQSDSVAALIALGYKKNVAEKAIRQALIDDPKASTESLIKNSLKYVSP